MKEPRPSLEVYKMNLAVDVASRSNCIKSHVGAIILTDDRIRAVGYNGTIEGYNDCFDGGCERCKDLSMTQGQDLDRCVCVHAEENALVSAARFGIPVEGSECFVTHEPCLGCTKLLIQARVRRVVYLKTYEYPEETGQNGTRARMREHSTSATQGDRPGTVFEQFGGAHAEVGQIDEWVGRLDTMKRLALEYAQKKGVLKPRT